MKTRRTNRADLMVANIWLEAAGMSPLPLDYYSDIGFIVPGVAVGFLILTNTKWCLLEHFITNPNASKRDRAYAMIEIAKRLIEIAKENDKTVHAWTANPACQRGLKDMGFVQYPGNFGLFLLQP